MSTFPPVTEIHEAKSAIKVVAVGGCHLSGHIVGKENSFLTRALQSAFPGRETSTWISPPTSVGRAWERTLSGIQANGCDLVVIQLGNFETSQPLIRKDRKSSQSNFLSGPFQTANLPPPANRANLSGVLLKSIVKFPVSLSLGLFGKKRLDLELMEIILDKYFAELTAIQNKSNIFALSTFPDLDPTIHFARSKFNKVLERSARKFGIVYVDVFDIMFPVISIEYIFNGHEYMADADHLNDEGHRKLGQIFSDELRKAFALQIS